MNPELLARAVHIYVEVRVVQYARDFWDLDKYPVDYWTLLEILNSLMQEPVQIELISLITIRKDIREQLERRRIAEQTAERMLS